MTNKINPPPIHSKFDSFSWRDWHQKAYEILKDTAPITKPATVPVDVTGAKGGNVALANLITALASWGLITDSTT